MIRWKNELIFTSEELERARTMPITFDEDCPETTPERAMKFKRVNPVRHVANWVLTHNLTHTAKKADRTSGADRMEKLIFPEQKGPETAEHQQFPVFQSVGKDEVTSSNLVSSSKKIA